MNGIHIFLWSDIDQKQTHNLIRLIVAYHGMVEYKFTENITHVISNTWHNDFDNVIEKSPGIAIVSPSWIIECCNNKKLAKTSLHRLQNTK